MILSPVKNRSLYYLSFLTGLATVQLLQLVHFESEEFDPEKHVLSRKLRAGRVWLELMTVYSVALIAFGVGLKAFLYSVVCSDDGGHHRRHRHLGGSSSYDSSSSSYESSSSYSSSSSSGSTYSSSYSSYSDGDDAESPYCDSVPQYYVELLCASFMAQYISQQISITVSPKTTLILLLSRKKMLGNGCGLITLTFLLFWLFCCPSFMKESACT
jgi:hypothetical protein